MISVSWYSAISAVAIFSVALVVIFALRNRTDFLKRYGVSVLILTSILALTRLVLPLDFLYSYVVESKVIIPAVRNFFQKYRLVSWFLIAVWICGAAAILARDIFRLVKSRFVSRNYPIVSDPRVERFAKALSVPYPVLVSPDVPVPYVSGIFRYTIYIPDMDLSDREIEHILMHELQHIRSHDAQLKLFWGVLSAVLWWNPIVLVFRGEVDALLEFRCDAKVTEPMMPEERYAYVQMLLHVAKRLVPVGRYSALALNESAALSAADKIFKQRIEVLLDNLDKEPRKVNVWVKLALAVLFMASYLIIFQPIGLAPIDEEEGLVDLASGYWVTSNDVDIVETLSSTCIVKINNQYYLFSDGQRIVELSPEEVFSEEYKDYIILEDCIP